MSYKLALFVIGSAGFCALMPLMPSCHRLRIHKLSLEHIAHILELNVKDASEGAAMDDLRR